MNLIIMLQKGFESWWFDPLTATLGFLISIFVYSFHEIQTGNSSYKTWHQFLWSKGSGQDQRHSLQLSLAAYWIGVVIWVQVVPKPALVIPSGLPDSIASLAILAAEVVSGIVLYDAYFFILHWAMHECKATSFLSHKEHHRERKKLEARHVLRHSLLDGSLQVLVNITVQRHTPWGSVKSRLARALHNIIVTWMLTESHTSCPYPNVFRTFCIGVREHRRHHLCDGDDLYGRFHRYQQFFGYLDDLRARLAFASKTVEWRGKWKNYLKYRKSKQGILVD